MSRLTIKDPAKSKSSETFLKVLRFIGRYRFLLILSIILQQFPLSFSCMSQSYSEMPLIRSLPNIR